MHAQQAGMKHPPYKSFCTMRATQSPCRMRTKQYLAVESVERATQFCQPRRLSPAPLHWREEAFPGGEGVAHQVDIALRADGVPLNPYIGLSTHRRHAGLQVGTAYKRARLVQKRVREEQNMATGGAYQGLLKLRGACRVCVGAGRRRLAFASCVPAACQTAATT